MQDRSVQVMDVDGVLGGHSAELVHHTPSATTVVV